MSDDRTRPDLDDTVVHALGKLSEALETVEQARGQLYAFHQHSGRADLLLQEAVGRFRAAGQDELADNLERELVGRNVIGDNWSFQLVEDFDANYWAAFRSFDDRARSELAGGDRHVLEARMKRSETTPGHDRHRPGPGLRTDADDG